MCVNRMNIIVFILIVFTFFIGDNVLSKYGIQLQYYKFFLIILCLLCLKKIYSNGIKLFPEAIHLLMFTILYTGFKIFTGGSAGNTNMGIIVILPILIFITYLSMERKCLAHKYKKILYIAYLFECGIAIIEKLLYINIFQFDIGDEVVMMSGLSSQEFRSIGLYGHPLQNALVVFTFILFILIYESNIKLKFLLSIIGVISIFCFNTRAAIVMSVLCIALYMLYWIKVTKKTSGIRITVLVCMFIVFVIIYNLYSSGVIGGRLSSMGLYDDDSASVRIAAWTIFDYYDLSDFIFGINSTELELLKYRVGLYAIENFWLNWILSYGVLFVAGLIMLYIPVMKKLFKKESKFNTFFIIVPFFVLASTNPSLAVSIVPMTSFLLLSYIMPRDIKK